ncbi:unnamed protein product, partial [Closterium sp. Naga37s-1]
CAPMAEAVRDINPPPCPWGQERIDGNCADPCSVMVCDAHASCVKEVGQLATCVCNWGFAMTSDQGCVDTCTLKACVDGTCSKDSVTGAAACSYTCVVKACDGACTHYADGAASCHCDADAGLVLLEDGRTCKDTCEVKACDGTCTKDADGVASCHCDADAGLVLLADERTCKDTCEVKACVDGTCSQDVNGAASCHCDADAGLVLLDDTRTCKDVCLVADCEGKDAKSTCVRNRDVAHCECVINYELFQGVCTDVCIIKDCEGSDANSTCVKNGIDATCVCKTGFKLFEGKCIGMLALPATTPPLAPFPAGSGADWCPFKSCDTSLSTCVRRLDGIPFCICNKGVPLTTKSCVGKVPSA